MELCLDDMIAALASPAGGARRGIVRVTGPDVTSLLAGWFVPDNPQAWEEIRSATCCPGTLTGISLRCPIRVDAYRWPNRRSYTGQPLVELHLPGSPPLLEAVLSETFRRGARAARPGEFTLRAFLAGRLDLLQAEAVLGVIDAKDHVELQTALSQLAGGLSGQLSKLRHDLLDLLADLEAGLDFVEEDIAFIGRCEVHGRIALARKFVEELLLQSTSRMQAHVRSRVVLAGLPNAGKSTLFNQLIQSDAAIVSEIEGTTRDFLIATVVDQDLTFDVVDTAGWEASAEPLTEAAQNKRTEQIQSADLLIWCSSAVLNRDQRTIDDELFAATSLQTRRALRVLTQVDRPDATHWLSESQELVPETAIIPEVSALTGSGLDDLAAAIRSHLTSSSGTSKQWLGMTAARCRESLEAVSAALEHAEESATSESIGDELIAVDLRDALDHLGQILGTVYTDDILDRVFSKFCIGK